MAEYYGREPYKDIRNNLIGIFQYRDVPDQICRRLIADYVRTDGEFALDGIFSPPYNVSAACFIYALRDFDGKNVILKKLPEDWNSCSSVFPRDSLYLDIIDYNWDFPEEESLGPIGHLKLPGTFKDNFKLLINAVDGDTVPLQGLIDQAFDDTRYEITGRSVVVRLQSGPFNGYEGKIRKLDKEFLENETNNILWDIDKYTQEPAPFLLEAAKSKSENVRETAICRIGELKIKDPLVISFLEDALLQEDEELISLIISVIHDIRVYTDKMKKPILDFIGRDVEIGELGIQNVKAVDILWELGADPEKIKKHLKTLVFEEFSCVWDAWYENDGTSFSDMLETVKKVAKDEEWYLEGLRCFKRYVPVGINRHYVRMLAEYKPEESAIQDLVNLLYYDRVEVSAYAAFYLGEKKLSDTKYRGDFLKMLKWDNVVRVYAAYLLRQFKDLETLKALEEVLKEAKYEVVKNIIQESLEIIKKELPRQVN